MEWEVYKENSCSHLNIHLLFPDSLGEGDHRVGLISANVISHHCLQLLLTFIPVQLIKCVDFSADPFKNHDLKKEGYFAAGFSHHFKCKRIYPDSDLWHLSSFWLRTVYLNCEAESCRLPVISSFLPSSFSVLIGAPKANTSQPDVVEGGAVYLCPWSQTNCSIVNFDTEGRLSGQKRKTGTVASHPRVGIFLLLIPVIAHSAPGLKSDPFNSTVKVLGQICSVTSHVWLNQP